MIDNQILIGAQRQAELEASKAAFFKSGGKVEALPAYEFKPLPMRWHPTPNKVLEKPEPLTERARRAKERAEQVAEMAKTMTCAEVSKAMGIPQSSLWTISAREGFGFFKPEQGHPNMRRMDRSEEEKMAERITALRDVGISRFQVERQLQVGHKTLARIIKDFGIDFPKRFNRS